MNEFENVGLHILHWNGVDKSKRGVSAGVYLYRIIANDYTETKKMILLDGGSNLYSNYKISYKQNYISKTSKVQSPFSSKTCPSLDSVFTITVEHESYHKYVNDNLLLNSSQTHYYEDLELLHKDSIDTEGFEQTIRAGNIAVLNDSTGGYINGNRIIEFKYKADRDYNPHHMAYYSSLGLVYKPEFKVGLSISGRYRFRTYAKLEGIEQDTLLNTYIVNVVERIDSLILDPNLEIIIRLSLNKYTDNFTTETLSKLKKLPLKNLESVTDLSGLRFCSNLTSISLIIQKISDLSELSYLHQLDTLGIGQQRVQCSDISPLSNLSNLTYLDIETNGVEDISPIGQLSRLKVLNLGYNPISDISSLENMINMEELSIANCDVSDISALGNMKNMKELFVGSCKIEDISSLNNMVSMYYLFLSMNYINDITPLANCKELIRLRLADNKIKDISVLEFLPKLNNVNLQGNSIVDIGPIIRNENFGEGCFLNISNNPLNEQSLNVYIPELESRGVYLSY